MTVKQYLKKIQDQELRTRALKNLQIERAGDWANNTEHALYLAFLWSKSPEGLQYWTAVHHNLKYPADQMEVPQPGTFDNTPWSIDITMTKPKG